MVERATPINSDKENITMSYQIQCMYICIGLGWSVSQKQTACCAVTLPLGRTRYVEVLSSHALLSAPFRYPLPPFSLSHVDVCSVTRCATHDGFAPSRRSTFGTTRAIMWSQSPPSTCSYPTCRANSRRAHGGPCTRSWNRFF